MKMCKFFFLISIKMLDITKETCKNNDTEVVVDGND